MTLPTTYQNNIQYIHKKKTWKNLNSAKALELLILYKHPNSEYICVFQQLSAKPNKKLHINAI